MVAREILELFAGIWILGMMASGASAAVKRKNRQRELEHAERMKLLEMGLVPQPSGIAWPAATVCIAIGAGVPIASFLVTWFASMTSHFPGEIWIAPSVVSVVAIAMTRKLALRIIDLKGDTQASAGWVADQSTSKPAFDPDAYDFVGRRG